MYTYIYIYVCVFERSTFSVISNHFSLVRTILNYFVLFGTTSHHFVPIWGPMGSTDHDPKIFVWGGTLPQSDIPTTLFS